MEVVGTIKKIGEERSFGASGFRKRELVLTTDEAYPQFLNIEFVQDKCNLLNSFSEGQKVKIAINLKGREWTNQEGQIKYFNSIQGWRIDTESASQSSENTPDLPTLEDAGNSSNDEDDLPF